ncbi:MipA/OmpV family protein [Psychrobium sp. 1_MG-2023]|uniref:MipA/OmpV family protein n=1 Tax=Psychrobium sp. 1_MG-2023 TaxID=3062624 RepID=UPI000C323D58|nr:MipA/OmpV family protein [Psychrobium sp. 1_MG-2023]MDP2562929.1 MipA/OmpV family protein [Psychrobium sp. 1_MG-2023]PKF54698.1 hypothetical protein CW748_15690 [Alteromonadales bacterium alter-6D02]
MTTLSNTLLISALLLSPTAVLAHGEHGTKHKHDKNEKHEKHDGERHIDIDFDGNQRDGFYLGVSAISSVGDNFYFSTHDDSEAEFDVDVSYRVQFLGLFFESPGLSSRRIHGLYATPAWGLNFFNNETWGLDLFYETDTDGIDGIEGIQQLNQHKRGGLRATGYFDNGQVQAIFTPYSSNKNGSDGIEASLSYAHNWQVKNWNFYANVGMRYRSKEVDANLAQNGFQAMEYKDSRASGISHAAEIGLEYPLSKDWVFGSFVSYNTLSDRVISSRDDDVEDGHRAGVLLTYVF